MTARCQAVALGRQQWQTGRLTVASWWQTGIGIRAPAVTDWQTGSGIMSALVHLSDKPVESYSYFSSLFSFHFPFSLLGSKVFVQCCGVVTVWVLGSVVK